jgi:outer membrane lipoprotein-sorting protein
MLDEDVWAYVPTLKRSVRVSLSQKLSGEAANGDIARTRWSGDYDVKIVEEKGDKIQLELKAQKKGLTYEGIKVWVDEKTHAPQKAEYLSLNGKLLKTATFSKYKKILGKLRPTQITIENALDTSKKSTIKILEMRTDTFPDSLFSKQNL